MEVEGIVKSASATQGRIAAAVGLRGGKYSRIYIGYNPFRWAWWAPGYGSRAFPEGITIPKSVSGRDSSCARTAESDGRSTRPF